MFKNNKTGKTIFVLILVAIISKISGFIREMVMAAYYGAGMESDAFFVAQTLPNIFFKIIGASLSLIFIPMFIDIATKKGDKKADEFASNVITMTLLFSLALITLGHVFAPYIVKIIAPGFREETFSLTIHLTRILFPMMLFITLSEIVTGLLQSREHFIIPSLVSIPSNAIIILGIIFVSQYYGVSAVAWATLIGMSLQLLIQLPVLKRRFQYQWKVDYKHKNIQRFGLLLIPVVMGTAVQQFNILVDRMLASGLQEGSISAISYADRLIGLGVGVFAMSIAVVIYPLFSRASAGQDYEHLKDIIRRTIIIIIMILLPFTMGTLLLRKELVMVVFGRGVFDETALHLTSYALTFYVLGAIPFSIREILVRGFFSLQDTKTPMINGAIAAVMNIILNVILVKPLGIGGLGLATSLTGVISIWMLYHALKNKIGTIKQREFVMDIVKIAAASIIMGVVVLGHKSPFISPSIYSNMFFVTLLGLITYFLSMALLGVKEFTKALQIIQKMIRNRINT